MADCLYECLKEAHLERYYTNFTLGGLTSCEALTSLSMQQYPEYGIVSMDDRLKLFKLIQIVKSVQSEGVYCQHKTHQVASKQEKKETHPPKNISKPPVNTKTVHVHGAPQKLQTKPPQPTVPTGRPKPNIPAGRPVPNLPGRQKYVPAHKEVIFKKGSDSPVFQCKKTLNFSDLDFNSTDEESPVIGQSKPRTSEDRNILDSPAEEVGEDLTANNRLGVSSIQHIPRSYFIPVDSPEPAVQEHKAPQQEYPQKVAEVQQQSAFVPHQVSVNQPSFVGELTHDKQSVGVIPQGKTQEDYPVHVPHPAFELHQVKHHQPVKVSQSTQGINQHTSHNLHQEESPKVRQTTQESLLKSQSFEQQLEEQKQQHLQLQRQLQELQKQQQEQLVKQQQQLVQQQLLFNPSAKPEQPVQPQLPQQQMMYTAQEQAMGPQRHHAVIKPFQFKSYQPSSREQHAYFPLSESPSKKQPYVERIVHSAGYNYGLPQSPRKDRRLKNGQKVPSKISVCIRKRPLVPKEVKRGECDVVRTGTNSTVVVEEAKVTVDLSKFIQQHVFRFDETFDALCSNEDVYAKAVRPLLNCALNRGNATCFAFGQTGSGKSYTLLGNKSVPGVYQLAARDLFAAIKSKSTRASRLWVSYYEIYCSQLFDLLNKKKKLHVRDNSRQKVCIAGLMETEVKDIKGLVEVVEYGNIVRSTGSTGVNAVSSRSHAILQLELRDDKDAKAGKMLFIDLAGSERASDVRGFNKQTRQEGAEINQSLLALKECIRSIDQDNKHTPYRQSKLTHILRDSFLGNSQTVMIATISPTQAACENTLNTLRYADRVKELHKSSSGSSSSSSPRSMENSNPASPKKKPQASTVFNPHHIQLSSTPKIKGSASPRGIPLDLSKVLHQAPETPIRGHKIVPPARQRLLPNFEKAASPPDYLQSPVIEKCEPRINEEEEEQAVNGDINGGGQNRRSIEVTPPPRQLSNHSTKSNEEIMGDHEEMLHHLDHVLQRAKKVIKTPEAKDNYKVPPWSQSPQRSSAVISHTVSQPNLSASSSGQGSVGSAGSRSDNKHNADSSKSTEYLHVQGGGSLGRNKSKSGNDVVQYGKHPQEESPHGARKSKSKPARQHSDPIQYSQGSPTKHDSQHSDGSSAYSVPKRHSVHSEHSLHSRQNSHQSNSDQTADSRVSSNEHISQSNGRDPYSNENGDRIRVSNRTPSNGAFFVDIEPSHSRGSSRGSNREHPLSEQQSSSSRHLQPSVKSGSQHSNSGSEHSISEHSTGHSMKSSLNNQASGSLSSRSEKGSSRKRSGEFLFEDGAIQLRRSNSNSSNRSERERHQRESIASSEISNSTKHSDSTRTPRSSSPLSQHSHYSYKSEEQKRLNPEVVRETKTIAKNASPLRSPKRPMEGGVYSSQILEEPPCTCSMPPREDIVITEHELEERSTPFQEHKPPDIVLSQDSDSDGRFSDSSSSRHSSRKSQENVQKGNLPDAEDFLRSLAEIKLARKMLDENVGKEHQNMPQRTVATMLQSPSNSKTRPLRPKSEAFLMEKPTLRKSSNEKSPNSNRMRPRSIHTEIRRRILPSVPQIDKIKGSMSSSSLNSADLMKKMQSVDKLQQDLHGRISEKKWAKPVHHEGIELGSGDGSNVGKWADVLSLNAMQNQEHNAEPTSVNTDSGFATQRDGKQSPLIVIDSDANSLDDVASLPPPEVVVTATNTLKIHDDSAFTKVTEVHKTKTVQEGIVRQKSAPRIAASPVKTEKLVGVKLDAIFSPIHPCPVSDTTHKPITIPNVTKTVPPRVDENGVVKRPKSTPHPSKPQIDKAPSSPRRKNVGTKEEYLSPSGQNIAVLREKLGLQAVSSSNVDSNKPAVHVKPSLGSKSETELVLSKVEENGKSTENKVKTPRDSEVQMKSTASLKLVKSTKKSDTNKATVFAEDVNKKTNEIERNSEIEDSVKNGLNTHKSVQHLDIGGSSSPAKSSRSSVRRSKSLNRKLPDSQSFKVRSESKGDRRVDDVQKELGELAEKDEKKSMDAKKQTATEKAQNLLILAHEDQLADVTQLCKREMQLLMSIKTAAMDYPTYLRELDDILTRKQHAINTLRAHISQPAKLT